MAYDAYRANGQGGEGLAVKSRVWVAAEAAARASQAALLRDIFGPLPFREVGIETSALSWNDSCIVKLAQADYDERQMPSGTLDNTRLAVLADALEEAGCADTELLDHLRSGGPHVRGCFALDAVLGKS